MFKNPFSFKGRIRRLEFGLSYIIYFIALMLITSIIPYQSEQDMYLLIAIIPMFWFLVAQGAKRCHDRGNTGWYQLIPFYSLWMLFADSQYGPNEYGINPKGLGNFDEIDQIGAHLIQQN